MATTITEQVRNRIKEAMRTKNPEKDILRVFLGKLQQIEADEGAAKLTDERCHAVARSIIKGNREAVATLEAESKPVPQDWREKLEAENKVLESFLPAYLSAQEIETVLRNDAEAFGKIASAANEGAATGVAMKTLKAKGLQVEGNTVKEVVKTLWSQSKGQ